MRFRFCLRLCVHLPAMGLMAALWAPTPVPGAPGKEETEPDSGKPSQSSPAFTFRVPVNVVLVNVTVTDRAGRPVKDVTVQDFKLFEDGKRQRIQSFEVESSQPEIRPAGADAVAGRPGPPTSEGQVAAQGESERTRLISCFVDDLTARSPRYFFWVISALQEFIAEEMGPQDQVGVFSASGRVRIPFTSDRKLLRERIGELHIGKFYLSRPYRSRCPVMTDVQVVRIVDGHRGIDFTRAFREATHCIGPQDLAASGIEQYVRAEAFHQYSGSQSGIQRLVAALRHHLQTLQHFSASKSLVLFSDGFVPARSMRWRLDQVVGRALRSRVVVNVVDIRGLHTVGFEAANNDQARNLTGEPISREDFNAGLDMASEFSGLFRDQTYQRRPLEKLSEETGGILFTDNNDLLAGLRQISNAQSFYYVLSYASPDQKANGKYHKIRVEVDRPALELSYRRGYFAPRKILSLEDRKDEDIQLALAAPGNFDQIPLQLAYRSSPTQDERHRLSVFTNVRIEGVPFQQEGERRRNLLHLLVMVYDQDGKRVDGSQKTIELNLSETSYRDMLQRGFTTRTEMEVPAGLYNVKAVVRESHQTRMGSLHQTVTLPIPESDPAAPLSPADLGVGEAARPSLPEDPAPSETVEPIPADEDQGPSLPAGGLESSHLVLSQQLTPLADLSAELQAGLLESGEAMIFGDLQIHAPLDDQIDRQFPVTFFYTLYNLMYPQESQGMTANIQLTDRWGKVSRFPLIPLGEGRIEPLGEGIVNVAFNLSFKNVQPGQYKLTVMTRAPGASGQSVGARTTVTVLQ